MAAIVQARGLSVGYHGKPILSELDLSIEKGELVALAGPNGVGKTTLLKTLGGIMEPLEGSVCFNGHVISDLKSYEKAKHISYLYQSTNIIWPFTVREFVAQGRFAHNGWFGREGKADQKAINKALERTDLGSFESRLVTELSGGELQRVLIARSIAQEAQVLLLDEPVSQLDARFQASTMTLIRALVDSGLAAVVILHDLNLAGLFADRIALFAQGRLAALGGPKAVIKEDILAQVYGTTMVVGTHPQTEDMPAVYHAAPVRYR